MEKRHAVGLLASMIGLGIPGCAWGPLKTGAPHIDKALAAIHEAGYPRQAYEGKGKFNPQADLPPRLGGVGNPRPN